MTEATVTRPSHYAMAPIKTMDELRAYFPSGKADAYNWLFLSTSGVHGSYTTLDDLVKELQDSTDDDFEKNPLCVTVLVVQPRTVHVRYGRVELTAADIPWLRRVVASTLVGVAASQTGNLPAGAL